MAIGARVRRGLGPLAAPAARLYRSVFLDVDEAGRFLASLGQPKRVLEIGGGDGMLAAAINRHRPDAEVLSIDIAPDPGGLFDGDRSKVTFRSMSTTDLLAEGPAPFDLVVLVDVLHHVPQEGRDGLLQEAYQLTAPGALLAIKDWERGRNPAHALAYGADRYITGDRNVAFPTAAEVRSDLRRLFPEAGTVVEARIPPRRNNVAMVLRRPA